jgi:hypothetical protein
MAYYTTKKEKTTEGKTGEIALSSISPIDIV